MHQRVSCHAVLVLVGNKTDLARNRVISEAEGQEYASSQGMLFVETSAKTAANTSELFELVARQIAMAAGTAQQPAAISAASSSGTSSYCMKGNGSRHKSMNRICRFPSTNCAIRSMS